MRREILLLAVALLVVAGVVTLAVAIGGSEFSEREAAATVERALKRCDQERETEALRCTDVGDGFVCRAGGRLIATFDEPNPEQPEFEVMC